MIVDDPETPGDYLFNLNELIVWTTDFLGCGAQSLTLVTDETGITQYTGSVVSMEPSNP